MSPYLDFSAEVDQLINHLLGSPNLPQDGLSLNEQFMRVRPAILRNSQAELPASPHVDVNLADDGDQFLRFEFILLKVFHFQVLLLWANL